jgi:hypothetical protein
MRKVFQPICELTTNILNIFISASELDIFELNHEYSSENRGTINKPIAGLKSRSLPEHLILSFFYTIRSAIKRLISKKNRECINDILFFYQGEKHAWALSSVVKHVPNSFIIDNTEGLSEHFSNFKARLLSLIFLPFLLKDYFGSKGYQRKSFKYTFDHYLLSYGNYIIFRRFFQKYPVKALVVANDHSYKCTTITLAAKDERVKTFYLQHASVNNKFPALKFDFALLEGMDAVTKYDRCGPSNTRIFLVGMPKLDAYIPYINKNNYLRHLGICTNSLDSLNRVEAILKNLRSDFPELSISLRPHPGDTHRQWKNLCTKYTLKYCDPLYESSFAFLSKVDAIVVGDSSIAMEAALLNVFPIYYDFPEMQLDHYDFIKNGLINKYTNQYDDIKGWVDCLVKQKPDIRNKTKRYCHTVDTAYDGKSSELAAKLITILTFDNNLNDKRWSRIENAKTLEVYEYRE